MPVIKNNASGFIGGGYYKNLSNRAYKDIATDVNIAPLPIDTESVGEQEITIATNDDLGGIVYEVYYGPYSAGLTPIVNGTQGVGLFGYYSGDRGILDLSKFIVSGMTSAADIFRGEDANDYLNPDISGWDTSSAESLDESFRLSSGFAKYVANWDTSSVTNMRLCFKDCLDSDIDIAAWDTSSVTDMQEMFSGATNFNSDISGWDVSSSETFSYMFQGAESFNQDLSAWDTSSSEFFFAMFEGTKNFSSDLSGWDVSNAFNLVRMFADSNFNGNVSGWTPGANSFNGEASLGDTFKNAPVFNQPVDWTIVVSNASRTFNNATSFNQSLDSWDMSECGQFLDMLNGATSFDQSLAAWDVTSATNMAGMLDNCGMSPANLDATLIAWSLQALNNNVTLGLAGLSTTGGASVLNAINTLENTYNWTLVF